MLYKCSSSINLFADLCVFKHRTSELLCLDVQVNKRLNILDSMLAMFKGQLENRHASHLTWIVIWLLVSQVWLCSPDSFRCACMRFLIHVLMHARMRTLKRTPCKPFITPTPQVVMAVVWDILVKDVLGFFNPKSAPRLSHRPRLTHLLPASAAANAPSKSSALASPWLLSAPAAGPSSSPAVLVQSVAGVWKAAVQRVDSHSNK